MLLLTLLWVRTMCDFNTSKDAYCRKSIGRQQDFWGEIGSIFRRYVPKRNKNTQFYVPKRNKFFRFYVPKYNESI